MKKARRLFDHRLETIRRVIRSCQTIEQLETSYSWGGTVLYNLGTLLRRQGGPFASLFAYFYTPRYLNRLFEYYLERELELAGFLPVR